MASDRVRLAQLIGQIHPSAWDAIHPHSHRPIDHQVAFGLSNLHLRRELDTHAQVGVEAAVTTRAFVLDLVRADASTTAGRDIQSALRDAIDDWCLTGWPRKWPRPLQLPPLLRPDDVQGPLPDPWLTRHAQVVGALVLADLADRLTSDLGADLASSADRLLETALS